MKKIIFFIYFLLQVISTNGQCQKAAIIPNGVGCLTIGMDIEDVNQYYATQPSFTISDERTIEPYVIVGKNDFLLQLKLDNGNYQPKVDAIVVLTSKVRTLRGIGVGSTINDFFDKYPDAELTYSYISGENGMDQLSGARLQTDLDLFHTITFFVDMKYYTKELDIDGDYMVLKKSDFNLYAPIKSILIQDMDLYWR